MQRYIKIANNSVSVRNRVDQELKAYEDEMKRQVEENAKFAKDHISLVKKMHAERLESGNYSEYSNMLVSIKNPEDRKSVV